MTVNRRSATRHDVAIAVTVRLNDQPNEPPNEATIRNLSLSGAYLSIGRRLMIGSMLSLRFRIPTHDHPIDVAAVVRWSTAEGTGVQFDGLRAGEVWSIGKYFEKL